MASIAYELVISGDAPSAVTAIIRFNEYRALACIDHAQAECAMSALLARLRHGIGARGTADRIEADLFEVEIGGGTNAIEALRYALSQTLTLGETRLRPTVAIAVAPRGACALTARARARAIAALEPMPLVRWSPEADDFAIEQELATAIRSGALTLHYQPIFDAVAGRVSGAEALMRWHSPTRGPISPAVFVPILERSRLIDDAGLWALSTACRDAAAWADAGTDLSVAVNISARQIQDDRLIDAVFNCLTRNGLPPHALELELTETAAMADIDRTRGLFAELRARGVRLSIDDFGAGYSNLNYLRSLSFDKLKIDRQFVTDIDSRADSQAICRAVAALTDGLGLDLLAEGIERTEEAEMLRLIGCRYFQGYHFGRPMPSTEFMRFVAASDAQTPITQARMAG